MLSNALLGREERMKAALAEVRRLSLQVDDFYKKLDLLKTEFVKLETRTVSTEQRATDVEDRAVLQEQEMPKRLDKAVEEYKGSDHLYLNRGILE